MKRINPKITGLIIKLHFCAYSVFYMTMTVRAFLYFIYKPFKIIDDYSLFTNIHKDIRHKNTEISKITFWHNTGTEQVIAVSE